MRIDDWKRLQKEWNPPQGDGKKLQTEWSPSEQPQAGSKFLDSWEDWALAVGTGGQSLPFQYGQDQAQQRQDADIAREQSQAQQRYQQMLAGMQYGEQRGEQLTGFTGEQLGAEVYDAARRTKQLAMKPSAEATRIRQTGQKRQEQLSRRGGTEAEKESSAYKASQMAGMAEDQAKERRESAYRRVLSGIMSTQSALAPAYGQVYNAASYIAPPRQNVGLLGGLGLV